MPTHVAGTSLSLKSHFHGKGGITRRRAEPVSEPTVALTVSPLCCGAVGRVGAVGGNLPGAGDFELHVLRILDVLPGGVKQADLIL